MQAIQRIVMLLLTLTLGAPAYATECQAGSAGWWQQEAAIMGTTVAVELRHRDEAAACSAIAAVMAEMRRIDALMSPYKPDSVLSQLNRHGADHAVFVGAELFDLIARSIRVSELTHGAFDVTYASVGKYYNYRESERPDAATIAADKAAIDYRHIVFGDDLHTLRFSRKGVSVDLGGIAKGYAVDRAARILSAAGIREAMVSAGGDSRVIGERDGEPWIVGVRDPRRPAAMSVVLPLSDVAVSTSGDYERFFEEGGVRYHHILDPQTGDSARKVQSVTILGDDATMTDALSTSVFVLGASKGIALIDRMPGFDAIVIDGSGHLHYSASLLKMARSAGS